jgi:hypothetical protein
MEEKLIFVIGSPRSGSTLLQRMLSSHSAIFSCPEPHILTPIAHLGYFHTVDQAPYDHLRAVDAIRGFVKELPHTEADYIEACKAYTDILYSRRLSGSGKNFFLDKTPAYALVLDVIVKLYPQSKYIVLTRHPAAIFCSYANSFFNGDYQAAQNFNPILNRYVPAIARFLRDKPVPCVHAQYEMLVQNPAREMANILKFLDLPFEEGIVEYGKEIHDDKGLGDPVSVSRHSRPMTASINKWTVELLNDDKKLTFLRNIIDSLDPEDLAIWGYPHKTIFEPLVTKGISPSKFKRPPLDLFQLERRILSLLRKNIHKNFFGRLVKKIRFFCDILLR